eukprot:scaffold10525_cov70-Phaeocystis_antarctica.AAC.1
MRLGELGRALDGRDVVDERLGRLALQLRLLEQVVGHADVGHVVVVEPVDAVHGLDGGQDEQVGLVLAQLGAALQYDLLEQFDELVRPVGRHTP